MKGMERAKKISGSRNKERKGSLRGFAAMTVCTFLVILISIFSRAVKTDDRGQVYAAADQESSSGFVSEGSADRSSLPTGIAGVATGVRETPSAGSTVERIGTSCEEVIVGQRIQKIKGACEFNVSSSMEKRVSDFDTKAMSMAQTPKMMSDADYSTLLHIVEAEAGTEDIKGRVLVANVIMNRVKDEGFPDTVTDVVWQSVNGVPQFSPTYDGRIYEVTVTDETKEAVRQAMNGTDYSQGALFFVEKAAAEKHNVDWFDEDLQFLFKHGVHDFYKYPDEKSSKEKGAAGEKKAKKADDKLVQMVKIDGNM